MYLLPNLNLNPRTKRKSSTKKHTLDPVYNEVLKVIDIIVSQFTKFL